VAAGLVVSSAEGRLPHPHRHSVDTTAPDVLRGSSSRRSKFRRPDRPLRNTSSLNRLILLRSIPPSFKLGRRKRWATRATSCYLICSERRQRPSCGGSHFPVQQMQTP
jgi:hypothetical protein